MRIGLSRDDPDGFLGITGSHLIEVFGSGSSEVVVDALDLDSDDDLAIGELHRVAVGRLR